MSIVIDKQVDVAIIGAGHAGLNAVKSVRKSTDNFVLINGGELGTTCARVGCMPSKAAVHIASTFHSRRKFGRCGIEGADSLRLDTSAAMDHVRDVRDMFVDLAQANSTDGLGEQLMVGYAEFLGPDTLKVDDTVVQANRIIIATGSSPIIPANLQQFQDRILTTDNLFEQPELPHSVAVIGLGAVGVELGQALHRMGVSVVGLNHSPHIAQLSDPQVNTIAIETLEREFPLSVGIPYSVERVHGQLRITADENTWQVDNLLVCTGRRPNLENLRIEKLGVILDERGIPPYDPHTQQIHGAPVFIAGDATGSFTTLPDAASEGLIAGHNAVLSRSIAFKEKARMSIVFCEPNIVEVGVGLNKLTEEEVVVGQLRFGAVGRAFIMGENRGLLRIYGAKSTGRVLGASMIGTRCEHLAHLLAWAIQQRLTVTDMLRLPYYHPVIEEGLKDACYELLKKCDGQTVTMPEFEPITEQINLNELDTETHKTATTMPTNAAENSNIRRIPTTATKWLGIAACGVLAFTLIVRLDPVDALFQPENDSAATHTENTVGTILQSKTGYIQTSKIQRPSVTTVTPQVIHSAEAAQAPRATQATQISSLIPTSSEDKNTTTWALTTNAQRHTDPIVNELLVLAQLDLAALRLTTPPESNAWERFQSVLALEPDNKAAREGLSDIVNRYIDLANNARAKGETQNARVYMARAYAVIVGQ